MLADDGGLLEQHHQAVGEQTEVAWRHEPGGHLDDAAVGLPDELRGLQVGHELVEGLLVGVEELVMDLGLAVGLSGRVTRHEGVRLPGLVLLALGGPLVLLGLIDHDGVGGDVVTPTQLTK
ncbi:MAG: hypothetical protein AB1Z67_01620 [Candidatus Limnocylindrales bacterium]